eukprot:SAG31_NODE_22464_length_525_cov_0.600939_1_plen_71_part_00
MGDGYLMLACVRDHPYDSFVCDTAKTYYGYVKSPLFVIENRFDEYALVSVQGLPAAHSKPTFDTTEEPPS